ncbi:hypothetical protein HYH03_015489 [Edaphochlamys debaryana]|uniref:Sulfotransferase n=1 Tax=Edaphochlamys debaryana TaxID=47281 RepID=A0A835XJB0_9CHLO|nr:hypothetical protein HYH03_015489 [Edaphochlamys debaryana]|eukprot:KAG2485777.1 hypothetical protein HYH03_015489 [Edaphochlamys debaryana]
MAAAADSRQAAGAPCTSSNIKGGGPTFDQGKPLQQAGTSGAGAQPHGEGAVLPTLEALAAAAASARAAASAAFSKYAAAAAAATAAAEAAAAAEDAAAQAEDALAAARDPALATPQAQPPALLQLSGSRSESGSGTEAGAGRKLAGWGDPTILAQQAQLQADALAQVGAAAEGGGGGGRRRDVSSSGWSLDTLVVAQEASVAKKCVVVLGTGRSGSTSLVDAMNQVSMLLASASASGPLARQRTRIAVPGSPGAGLIPNYFIRGEQEGAFYYLYLTWRLLDISYSHSHDFIDSVKRMEKEQGERAVGHMDLKGVKSIYERFAVQKKLPWFNDMHPYRNLEAARNFYTTTYGYHGPDVVSGFKEVRFVRGRAFQPGASSYRDFEGFIRFMRHMCGNVRVLFNSRRSASLDDNWKLEAMLTRNGVRKVDKQAFQEDMQITHEWYDKYAKENPEHSMRVIMEDMFDPKVNETLARELLSFLGEDPATPIKFDRMPTWHETKGQAAVIAEVRARERAEEMQAKILKEQGEQLEVEKSPWTRKRKSREPWQI